MIMMLNEVMLPADISMGTQTVIGVSDATYKNMIAALAFSLITHAQKEASGGKRLVKNSSFKQIP